MNSVYEYIEHIWFVNVTYIMKTILFEKIAKCNWSTRESKKMEKTAQVSILQNSRGLVNLDANNKKNALVPELGNFHFL